MYVCIITEKRPRSIKTNKQTILNHPCLLENSLQELTSFSSGDLETPLFTAQDIARK